MQFINELHNTAVTECDNGYRFGIHKRTIFSPTSLFSFCFLIGCESPFFSVKIFASKMNGGGAHSRYKNRFFYLSNQSRRALIIAFGDLTRIFIHFTGKLQQQQNTETMMKKLCFQLLFAFFPARNQWMQILYKVCHLILLLKQSYRTDLFHFDLKTRKVEIESKSWLFRSVRDCFSILKK